MAATDEELLGGDVDPESLSRDQLYVRIQFTYRLLPIPASTHGNEERTAIVYVAGELASSWSQDRWLAHRYEREIKVIHSVANGVYASVHAKRRCRQAAGNQPGRVRKVRDFVALCVLRSQLYRSFSVYSVGANHQGQLGTGDTMPREVFTCIPGLRGKSVDFVSVVSIATLLAAKFCGVTRAAIVVSRYFAILPWAGF